MRTWPPEGRRDEDKRRDEQNDAPQARENMLNGRERRPGLNEVFRPGRRTERLGEHQKVVGAGVADGAEGIAVGVEVGCWNGGGEDDRIAGVAGLIEHEAVVADDSNEASR